MDRNLALYVYMAFMFIYLAHVVYQYGRSKALKRTKARDSRLYEGIVVFTASIILVSVIANKI